MSPELPELRDGQVKSYTIAPEDFSLPRATLAGLVVHSLEEAAQAVRDVLAGKKGPHRDIVLLNAGAAIMVSGAAPDLAAGIKKAAQSVDSGAAAKTLEKLITVSQGT